MYLIDGILICLMSLMYIHHLFDYLFSQLRVLVAQLLVL
jgi:hypothetical protein